MVHNRRNIKNSIIIAALIICTSIYPVFATTSPINVEIRENGTDYFHAYNSNTNVVNSFIDAGASSFSKAFNYMATNIAKMTSSAYSINSLSTNIYSRLGTMDSNNTSNATNIVNAVNSYYTGLFGTNGIASNIALIKSYVTTSDNHLLNIDNAIGTDYWHSFSYSPKYYDNGFNEVTFQAYKSIGSEVYIDSPNTESIPSNAIIHITLPLSYYSNTQYLTLEFDTYRYGTINPPLKYMVNSMRQVDIYYIVPLYVTGTTYIHLSSDIGVRFTLGNPQASYISQTDPNYKYYLELLTNAQYHNDTINALNNIQVTADFDDSDIIDAINNLSLQDNDVKLNLTINNNTGNDGTNIITRLQNFFDTGVSVSDFFNNVDNAESGWFTQSNSDIINTLSGGYTDFYE